MFNTGSTWSKDHLYGVSIFWDHVWTMVGPCLAYLYFQTSLSTDIFNIESLCLWPISMECLFFGTMSGLCSDHVRPSFTSRPPRALKFSSLNKHGLRPMSMEFILLGPMSGPCWDHVWSKFTSRPARELKFSRLSQHGLRTMCMECLILETMSRPLL